ncbi:hypothetical protein IFM89_011542 [Coptis chinensis]|uniref:NB-ARC domain-containing protein n=1 Tax=Coptis chinensis TaxID=261450 RepID=A0A835IVK8_9MAGN|nr:hypothetical protein IFM89_011542 [Coptis chinensis]
MGSRVMLTTRNEDVALHAVPSTHHHHALRLLNKDESWELFSKKVFTVSGSCSPKLVEVGRRIVDKCGGLSLAIVVLGGPMMGKERTHLAWSKVIASANWKLSQDSNPCRAILALSYTDLPFHLKPCFLYLGLFPEDHEIDVNKLISLWVAEGFVQSRRDEKMEDVADDYLEELIQRNKEFDKPKDKVYTSPSSLRQLKDCEPSLLEDQEVQEVVLEKSTKSMFQPGDQDSQNISLINDAEDYGIELFDIFCPPIFDEEKDSISAIKITSLEYNEEDYNDAFIILFSEDQLIMAKLDSNDRCFERLTTSLKDLTSSSHLEDQMPSSRKLKSFAIAILWQVILLMTLLVFGERDYSMFVSSRSSCHQTQSKLTMERLGNTTNHDHMKWPFNHHNHFQARGTSRHSCVFDDIHALDPGWKLDFLGGVAYKSHSVTKFDMLLMEKPHHLENSSLMHGATTLVDGF